MTAGRKAGKAALCQQSDRLEAGGYRPAAEGGQPAAHKKQCGGPLTPAGPERKGVSADRSRASVAQWNQAIGMVQWSEAQRIGAGR